MKDDHEKNRLDRLKNYDPKSGEYHTQKPAGDTMSSSAGSGQSAKKPSSVSSHTIEIDMPPKPHSTGSGTSSKELRKQHEAQEIEKIREQNQALRVQKAQAKRDRALTLAQLDASGKRAFLENEKAQRRAQQLQEAKKKAEQKDAYKAMSKQQKKSYRAEQRRIKKRQKQAKKGYVARQIIKYILIAALVAVLCYGGYLAYAAFIDHSSAFGDTGQALSTTAPTTQPSPTIDQTQPAAAATEGPTPSPTLDPYSLLLTQADLDFMENRVNILVLGIDESLERADWGSFRTDTMILVSIDFEENTVDMLSLPRDSFVTIYNTGEHNRINTAFGAGGGKDGGGFQNAMDTVSMTLGGVPVNHYVCFDMNVVKEVVNAIGGLYYDVDINVDMCGRTIEPGYQYMDGQMVLDYCRQRKGDSDIQRADRQQRMIFAIFNEIKQSGQMKDIPDIYKAVTGNIYTDLEFAQIVSLAAFGMGINLDDLSRYMLPGKFLNIDQTSYWGLDQYKKRDLVKELFGVDIKVNASDNVTYWLDLAAQKNAAVTAAVSAAESAQAYVDTPENTAVITPEELADFNTRKADLLAVAAVRAPTDVEPTIQPIIDATEAFNTYFDAFKVTIEARKAAPTPSPSSSASPTAAP